MRMMITLKRRGGLLTRYQIVEGLCTGLCVWKIWFPFAHWTKASSSTAARVVLPESTSLGLDSIRRFVQIQHGQYYLYYNITRHFRAQSLCMTWVMIWCDVMWANFGRQSMVMAFSLTWKIRGWDGPDVHPEVLSGSKDSTATFYSALLNQGNDHGTTQSRQYTGWDRTFKEDLNDTMTYRLATHKTTQDDKQL